MSTPAAFRRPVLLAALCFFTPGLIRAQPQIKNPGTFVYAIAGAPESLDPDWEFDGISHEITSQIYETLIAYQGWSVNQFVPRLASVVPSRANGLVSQDGLRYAFPIREKVHFQNGSLMTPEDVKYSLMRCMLMDRVSGPSYLLLDPILGVSSAAGKDGKPKLSLYDQANNAIEVQFGSVVIYLSKPYPPLLSVLANYCPVVSKDWIVSHGGWDGAKKTWAEHFNPSRESAPLFDQGNGTGPFGLVRWDRQNQEVVLARNDGYWRAPAKLQNVVFKTVDNFQTRKLMLAAGDADAIMVDRAQLPQIQGLPGVSITDNLPMLEVHDVFLMNFAVNPQANPFIGSGKLDGDGIPPGFFADTDIRHAMAYAFDYDSYIKDAYQGHAFRARGPIPSNLFGYNANQPVLPYDLTRAADRFKKALGGQVWEKGFRFTLVYQQGYEDRRIEAEILKKNVESLNPKFRIDVMAMDWPQWLAALSARRLPMTTARWLLDYPDPDDAVTPFLYSQGYYAKLQGYSNPRADGDVLQARSTSSGDRRARLYADLQAIAYADVPQVYTVETYYVEALRSWVHDWHYNPIRIYGSLYPVSKGGQ
ncbi:MAG: ABC transporter substrate-binding protein [Elusimicrobia bacterium]|nr:ABC transporter substrate-binding protein [Elusimicrobiota bacterium]